MEAHGVKRDNLKFDASAYALLFEAVPRSRIPSLRSRPFHQSEIIRGVLSYYTTGRLGCRNIPEQAALLGKFRGELHNQRFFDATLHCPPQ